MLSGIEICALAVQTKLFIVLKLFQFSFDCSKISVLLELKVLWQWEAGSFLGI